MRGDWIFDLVQVEQEYRYGGPAAHRPDRPRATGARRPPWHWQWPSPRLPEPRPR
ncbi:hypothetical protein SAMN04489732_101203 [Amycolatopsis saalfeldensis]|uniref:Uncharacterized protein n=1 Tax=Amycolatopsis saalfeldensis TaxID=394193 RepID=A0A1H8Q4F9_9PSEU|nr:hypothetical protein SAMN04489732_101203 [Amycolatopsis saalfeldensis]